MKSLYSEDDRRRAREMYEKAGWSCGRIAMAIGCEENTVNEWKLVEGWEIGGSRPKGGVLTVDEDKVDDVLNKLNPPKKELVVAPEEEKVSRKLPVGENLRLANKKGLGLRYQLDRAAYLSQARAIPVPTGHGFTFIPIDVGSWDSATKTYVNPLDGSQIAAHLTVPLYGEQARGLQMLANLSGTSAIATADAAGTRVKAQKQATKEVESEDTDDGGDRTTKVNIMHPGYGKEK